MPKAHLVAVGSELLAPGREDSNMVFLRSRLYDMGIEVETICVVGDDEAALIRQLDCSSRRAGVVIMTGGLGPTEDDITKKTLARFLKKTLRYNEQVKNHLEDFFAERKVHMPENCLRQALIPTGGRVMLNRVGTAPGLLLEERGCLFVLLPGPPAEMQPMFDEQAAAVLEARFGRGRPCRRHLRLTGIPESKVDQLAAPIYRRFKEVRTTILSRPGEVELIMTGREGDPGPDRLVDELLSELGGYVYSSDGRPLEEVVGGLLRGRNLSLAVAESCTGGYLSKRLTDVPGSSDYFLGGVVCYSNELKMRLVGVPADILEKHGAVSSACAAALATGVRQRAGADLALAITGVAGPGGGTAEKPVGLVYFGAVWGERLVVKKFHFKGDREAVRFQSTQMAMEILRRLLAGTETPATRSEREEG